MPVTLSLLLACAAASCGTDEAGKPAAAQDSPAAVEAATASGGGAAEGQPTPAKLVSFDGAHDFMKTSRRLRVWREAVDLDMTIGANGEATDCKVINEFRKTYVNKSLCEVAMAHYTFEPARNSKNEAVVGSYRAHISYAELREELD